MPNQRDKNKRLVGGYVHPEIKAEIARIGKEEATALEMLLVEGLMRHGYLKKKDVERMALDGKLRVGTVIWLRAVNVLDDPLKMMMGKAI
jgi:hypothetical protein